MITTWNGEIFTFDDGPEWTSEKIEEFFKEHGGDAIIELVSDSGLRHITYEYLTGEAKPADIRIHLSADMFKEAFYRTENEMRWIVCDDDGNYLTILKAIPSYYLHSYGTGEVDVSFLNKYDALVFYGLNEYAVEIYRRALPKWTGRRVVLCGEWPVVGDVLPGLADKEIILQSNWNENNNGMLLAGVSDNVLHIGDRLPRNEDPARLTRDRIIMLEELMTYTFCFSNVQHFGNENPDKKYFVIDGNFTIEGIFGIQDKAFAMAKYVKSKGYIPLFYIVNSTENIYSDFLGDDIWGKFMNQADGHSIDEMRNAKNVCIGPNSNCLSIMRYMINEATDPNVTIDWPDGLYNKDVENYIAEHGKIMTEPKETLGVLIRGTDYQKTKMPGHAIHATTAQMIEKIHEVEKTHPYKYIYLATEDEEVLAEMKREFGERLIYTDQERFTIEEGELLVNHHNKQAKERGKGFRLGAEYLCTLRLLSQCESLVASGGCGGVGEAIKENKGKYRMTYVFDLGKNAR